MKPEIVVGTSGFSFGDWVGPFYPPGTPRTKMLELYAETFAAVEVNATYYRIPPPSTMASLAPARRRHLNSSSRRTSR